MKVPKKPIKVVNHEFSQPEIIKTKFSKKYICTDKHEKKNHSIEALFIFLETMIKKLLRIFASKKHRYFSKGEDKEDEHKNDQIFQKIDDRKIQSYIKNTEDSIVNIGHATNLIKSNGFKILTDPVFNHLNPILYRSKTETDPLWKNKETWNTIELDVIVISHNHRDHVDAKTLKMFAKKLTKQPMIIVPEGDKKLFTKMGFKNVQELKWYEQIELENNRKKTSITAVAADHWSGRGVSDAEKSATSGYLINNLGNSNIFYFAGDTAKLSDKRIADLAVAMFFVHQEKNDVSKANLPNFINIEPDGPNYSRKDMKSTHQSIIESVMSSFRLAIAMKSLPNELKTGINNQCNLDLEKITHKELFEKIELTITHHNKYELGPDRFNEGKNILEDKILPIFKAINGGIQKNKINALKAKFEELKNSEQTRKKENYVHVLRYYKDWLYEEMIELIDLTQKILPNSNQKEQSVFLQQYLEKVSQKAFPKINEMIEYKEIKSEKSEIR